MKKPFKNTEMSERRCGNCRKLLKKNLLAKHPDAGLCYRCWRTGELARRRRKEE